MTIKEARYIILRAVLTDSTYTPEEAFRRCRQWIDTWKQQDELFAKTSQEPL